MIVLGLNFGHDAGAVVIRNGHLHPVMLRERFCRIKASRGLDTETIDAALAEANIDYEDVDFVAIVTSQRYAFRFIGDELTFKLGMSPDHPVRSTAFEAALRRGDWLRTNILHNEEKSLQEKELGAKINLFPTIDQFHYARQWTQELGLSEISRLDVREFIEKDHCHFLHAPIRIAYKGTPKPGYMIHHHLAHAADSFYSSPFDEAAVLTLDGSGSTPHGYYGGIFYYGKGDKLFPLHPHNLLIGQTYLRTAVMLGLGANGSGKLMGLAPYGEPLFHEDEFVGNWPDISNALSLFVPLFTSTAIMELTKVWQYRFTLLARQRSMDVSVLGDADRVTDPFPAAVAASMQSIFQTTILRALEAFLELLERNGVGTSNLAFGGGSALNVVTNQAIPRSTAFRNVSVGPTVDDSGLAIGAAYALAHCILNEPRAAISDAPSISTRAYQGRKFDESMIRDAAGEFGDTISIEKPSDFIERAADDVVEGRIIGWFEGRSEIGPRALGHRSLVADPTRKDAWPRMNRLKGREMWRPLAPSVLVERVDEFFGDMPAHSPFMTFNSTVLTDRLPAITHVDGTARVQTVRPEVGGYYSLIKAVGDRNGVPVVMNTSFNGPEEPIVDTPTDAIRFLVNTDLDALYIEGLRVTRAES